jgi:hypothetical protein
MSSATIGGKKRESLGEFSKKVGLFEAKVVAINPNAEQYKDVLGFELKEDSKATEYLGESKEGNTQLRIDVWLEEIKTKEKFKLVFFLEDKLKSNKDGSKQQYINAVGTCSWADDPNNLPAWFTAREYREAYVGEEELYNFLRVWLSNLDTRAAESVLYVEWKKLMKGNVSDLQNQIDGEWCDNVVALATIKTVVKDEETKEYQSIYNRGFLYPGAIKHFRLVDYSNASVLEGLRRKKPKDLKPHERFVVNVTGEYGVKDFYILKELKEYDPSENFVSSDAPIADGDPSY